MVQTSSVVSIAGLLIFGTLSSIASKVVYQTEGETFDGSIKSFKKPWASTALMFVAMVMCLPIAWIARLVEMEKKKKSSDESKPLIGKSDGKSEEPTSKLAAKNASLKEILILGLPMCFDLTATLLMSIGLLYVTASVYQMLRGAEILFSAIFAVIFLKRSLNKFHYCGIAGCLVGICMVGASSLLSPSGGGSSDTGMVLLGMGLIVVAQAVQAAQVTMEDYAMSHVGLAPLQVVGYEGLLGTIVLFGILMPIVYFIPGKDGQGLHEDSLETAYMIGHSEPRWTIPVVLIANSMSLLLYNVAGMFVTEEMGAVSRTVFESARTLFVWLGDLLLYYTHTGLGEKWDNSSYLQACHSHSPSVQAAGFLVLVAGTLVYAQGDRKQEEHAKDEHDGPLQAVQHEVQHAVFKFHHTISSHPQRNLRARRWRRAINSALATAHLRNDEENNGSSS
ncbi:g3669 [Coccomyxa viridis]|uniref:G3669 protein n=1 Tax=Coccomyxa viridis TaxID=1274662 RepID=A0ABP1FVI1_9CHLO